MHNTIRKTVLAAAAAVLCLAASLPAYAEETSHTDVAVMKDEAAGKDGTTSASVGKDVTVVENGSPDRDTEHGSAQGPEPPIRTGPAAVQKKNTWTRVPAPGRRKNRLFPRKPPLAGSPSPVTADAISVRADTGLPIPARFPRLTTPFLRTWTSFRSAPG